MWFFTPLSFSIPFIFFYIFYFTEGIEKENKQYIITSLTIMSLLLIVHSISVLFSIPFLLIYAIMHKDYLKKEYKFFSIFIIIPIIGLFFYKFMKELSFNKLIPTLFNELQFKYGWGVIELSNSFFELYSLVGITLAILGTITILLLKHKQLKKYSFYLLWPATVLLSLIIFRLTGISYLVPYQRNIHYFTLSLPILSAFGLYSILKLFKKIKPNILKKILITIFFILIIYFTFRTYFYIPDQVSLYKVIDNEDYNALLYLKTLSKGKVMATPEISTALYPISEQKPVATIVFYGNKGITQRFFLAKCTEREKIIKKHKIDYILFKHELGCNWSVIYDKNNYIYNVS